jgi:DNA polymerase III subunit epsilon
MAIREIILDTETTGLSPLEGHRIVEIGAVELVNHLPTGKTFHVYLNPDRDMPREAEAIHGLSSAFLRDKPKFKDMVKEFLDFVAEDVLIIHNASFDMGFLNSELAYCEITAIPPDRVIDTLLLARKAHPMGPNSLDALCRRYGVDNSKRTKHGALLDAELLAEVYLHLIGGRQTMLGLQDQNIRQTTVIEVRQGAISQRPEPLSPRLSSFETEAHAKAIESLGPASLWRQ